MTDSTDNTTPQADTPAASDTPAAAPQKKQDSYPLSQRFSLNYSALEDRIVLRATRRDNNQIIILLTRRMVLMIMQQVLSRLPALAGLEKTPREFWAEVLQLGHQQAMQEKAAADAKAAPKVAVTNVPTPSAAGDGEREEIVTDPDNLVREPIQDPVYLATDLVVGSANSGLTLAYKGLRMPAGMTQPTKSEPVVAIPLEITHLHQLIDLLVAQSRRADWHLPLDLPWLEAPDLKVPDAVITH